MYDNDRDHDADHGAETEPEGGLKSTFHRFMERLTGNNHDDYVDEDERSENHEPAEPAAAASASGSGARVYGAGSASTTTVSGNTYGRVSTPQPARSRDTFRTAPAMGRDQSISVMPIASFGDVQKAADRLKAGEPQIVNLEKTPPEVAERLIDFLNGVTYALDGYVEKVSEGAYLFTPSHIAIHADGPEQAPPKPYFDRL